MRKSWPFPGNFALEILLTGENFKAGKGWERGLGIYEGFSCKKTHDIRRKMGILVHLGKSMYSLLS